MPRRATFRLEQADANTLLGGAALLTSVIAVLVAWDESRVLRQAYRTAFTPIVEVRADLTDGGRGEPSVFAIDLRNVGPGVARIEAVSLRADGEPVRQDLAAAMFPPALAPQASVRGAPVLGYLKADEALRAASVSFDGAQRTRGMLAAYRREAYPDRLAALTFGVCYCSLFEECWETGLGQAAPRPVSACEPSDDLALTGGAS